MVSLRVQSQKSQGATAAAAFPSSSQGRFGIGGLPGEAMLGQEWGA